MDSKLTSEKSALQLEKGDSESKIISTLQQQQQPFHNEKAFLLLQYYLLWLMRTEKRMHDTNEANFQFWIMVSSHYLTTCNNLMKVVNADFGYSLSLQVMGGDKNFELLKTRCRMLDSYELMIVVSQSLQRIHLTLTKFIEQNKFCWKFRLIMSYMKDLEKKLKSTDQCIKSVENTINITTAKYV